MKLALAADVEVLEASGMTVRGRPALRPGQSLIMCLKHWQWLHRAWESGRQSAMAETLLELLEGLRFLRVSAHDSLLSPLMKSPRSWTSSHAPVLGLAGHVAG